MLLDYLALAILANFVTWWFEPFEPVRKRLASHIDAESSRCQYFLNKELFCPRCQSFLYAIVYAFVAKDLVALMIVPFLAEIVRWILIDVIG